MKLNDLQLDDNEVRLLAGATETALGRAVVKVLRNRATLLDRECRRDPEVSRKVKKHLYHKLGKADGLSWLEDELLPAARAANAGKAQSSIT